MKFLLILSFVLILPLFSQDDGRWSNIQTSISGHNESDTVIASHIGYEYFNCYANIVSPDGEPTNVSHNMYQYFSRTDMVAHSIELEAIYQWPGTADALGDGFPTTSFIRIWNNLWPGPTNREKVTLGFTSGSEGTVVPYATTRRQHVRLDEIPFSNLTTIKFKFDIRKPEGEQDYLAKLYINDELIVEETYDATHWVIINFGNGFHMIDNDIISTTYSQSLTITKLEINGKEDCECQNGCHIKLGKTTSKLSEGLPSNINGTGTGELKLNLSNFDGETNISSPQHMFNVPSGLQEELINNSSGQLHQIYNSSGLTQIDVIDEDTYTVKQYSIDQVGAKDAEGFYTVTGDPDTEITFSKTQADPNTLNIEEKKGGAVVSNTSFSFNTTDSKWTMGQDTDGDGTIDRFEYEDVTTDGSNTVKTAYILNGDQSVASKIQRTYDSSNNLIEEIIDPDGAAITTSYTYTNGNLTRTDFPDGSFETITYTANNLPELTTRSSGLFTKNEYDANDRIIKTIESFNNSTYTASESDHKVTTYDFTPVYTGDDGSVDSDSPRAITVSLLGNPVSKTYYGYLTNEEHVIQGATPTSEINDSNNLVSSTFTNAEGEVIKTIEADGSGSVIEYDTTGDTTTTTTYSGVFNAGNTAIVEGTETVEIVTNDLEVSSHTFDIASGLLLNSRVVTERDSADREKRVDYHDSTYEMFIYGCCNLDSTRSREGIWTDYTYDALGRQVTSTTNGITETTTYDATGNVDTRTQTGTDGTTRTLVDNDYDLAGRLVSSKDALNYETTYSEEYGGSMTTSITTYPDNSYEITWTDPEGRLLGINGTAVFSRTSDLEEERVELDASLGYHVHIQRSGEDDNWVDSFTDALGRVFKTVTINGATSQQFYEAGTGRLVKTVSESGAVTLYYEDPANNIQIEALDVNQNDVIDYGTDTITRVQSDVIEENSIIWNRTQTWANPDSLANPGAADNINKVSNDGLARVNTSITNGISSTFEMNTEVGEDGVLTSTATRPDGSYSETKFINGLQDYEKSFDINDALLHEVTFGYDIFNRLETQTDSRNGTTTYSYNLNDRVLTLTTSDPDGAGPQTAQTFTNQYNNMGRRDKVINPDGTEIHFEYTTQGLIEKSYGANVYTRKYIYDNEGQLESIQTWKNATAETGQNDITWSYNAQGQLQTETDKQGRITSYTYYDNGLLETRVSPRGITKTYAYDTSGRLLTITYSDSTPSISFTYNELGQLDTITDELGTRQVKYNSLGQFKGNLWTAGVFNGVESTYNYDNIGRQQSLVRDIGTQQKSVSYDYDDFGRLQKVIKGTYEFEYTYLDNAPNTVEKMTVYKDSTAQIHSKREFDKIMRAIGFSWATGGGQ